MEMVYTDYTGAAYVIVYGSCIRKGKVVNDVVTYTIKYLISPVGKKSGGEQSRAYVVAPLCQNHKPYVVVLYVVSISKVSVVEKSSEIPTIK